MSTRSDPDSGAEARLFDDDLDTPIDEWSLDELDSSGDLGSLRSAWATANDLTE